MALKPPIDLDEELMNDPINLSHESLNSPSVSPSSFSSGDSKPAPKFDEDLTPVSSNDLYMEVTTPKQSRRSSPSPTPSSRKGRKKKDGESLTDRKKKVKSTFNSKQFKIFRNLLLLEQSMRIQYTEQQSLRFKFLTFYLAMVLTSALVFIRLYFVSGFITNSTMNVILKFLLAFQVITLILFHLSGEYRRTIILPRRFLYLTNKSLRQLNLRLIKLPKTILDQIFDVFKDFLELALYVAISFMEKGLAFKQFWLGRNILWSQNMLRSMKILSLKCVLLQLNSKYDQMNLSSSFGIKLSLSPRVFNPSIREDWELFRNEFWLREFNRRTKLIYSVTFDSDVEAIEKMVLRNELVRKPGSVSKVSSPILKSQPNSPSRTPIARRLTTSLPLLNAETLTPITSQILKSGFDSSIMNKFELLKKDKDDRKVRRKSQIMSNLVGEFENSDANDEEVIEIDEEKKNKFDEININDEIKKRKSRVVR